MKLFLRLPLVVFLGAAAGHSEAPPAHWDIKPYQALIVVEHWSDPSSVVVDHERDNFQPV